MNFCKVGILSLGGWGRVRTLGGYFIGPNARGEGVTELRESHDPKGENTGR